MAVGMSEQLNLLLMKLQGTFGTAEGTLATGDTVETVGVPRWKVNPNSERMKFISAGHDVDPSVPGLWDVDLSFEVMMRVAAAEDMGIVGDLMQMCCMTETLATVNGTNDQGTYVFSSTRSDYQDATAWLYSGDLSTSGSILKKASNFLLAPKWTFTPGQGVRMELSGKGVYGGAPTAATMPSATKLRTVSPPFIGAGTLSLYGVSGYKLLSAEIDPQLEYSLTTDPTATYGRGVNAAANRTLQWQAKVYRDVPGTVDPYTAIENQTSGALSFVFGTEPQKQTYSATYAQVDDIDEDSEEGIETWTLRGVCQRDDFSVVLNTVAAP